MTSKVSNVPRHAPAAFSPLCGACAYGELWLNLLGCQLDKYDNEERSC